MGYTISIGELKTEVTEEGIESIVRNYAQDENHENAPSFGEPTDYTNSRWPSYSAWRRFTRFVDIEDLFYNEHTGIMRQHPGCFPLVKEHKEIIDKAHKKFYEKYPNAKAGYSPKINEKEGIWEDPEWPLENNYAVRLEWLKYWVDWALENCKTPVIYNS